MGINGGAFQITQLFIKAYPPSKMPKLILLTALDLWAAKHKLYAHADGSQIQSHEVAAWGQARQRLREMINEVACSDNWRLAGNTPFHLDIHALGLDYLMSDLMTAANNKNGRMPQIVKGFVTAKDRRIVELESAIDYKLLTHEQRLKMGMFARARATALRRLSNDADDLATELEEIIKHQERMKNPPQIPERGT